MWAHILYAVICVFWTIRGIDGILEHRHYDLQQKNQRPQVDMREYYKQSPYR